MSRLAEEPELTSRIAPGPEMLLQGLLQLGRIFAGRQLEVEDGRGRRHHLLSVEDAAGIVDLGDSRLERPPGVDLLVVLGHLGQDPPAELLLSHARPTPPIPERCCRVGDGEWCRKQGGGQLAPRPGGVEQGAQRRETR